MKPHLESSLVRLLVNGASSSALGAAYAASAHSCQVSQGIDLIALTEKWHRSVGSTVLDVGCGTGELTRAWAARVGPTGRVHGCDPDVSRIDIAQSMMAVPAPVGGAASGEVPLALGALTFGAGDATALPAALPDGWAGAIDVIYSNHVLHWVKAKETFLRHAMATLKPGGLVVLQSPESDIKLLTRLLKLTGSQDSHLGRAIQIRGLAKVGLVPSHLFC
jgi:ubiquinone/menaquinone biosynthesis C-methylase UbiE